MTTDTPVFCCLILFAGQMSIRHALSPVGPGGLPKGPGATGVVAPAFAQELIVAPDW